MESFHKLIVLRNVLKVFVIIVCMWLVSLLTIITEYKSANMLIFSDKQLYERALNTFRKIYDNNTVSAFRVWELLPPSNASVTDKEKMLTIKGYDDPPGINGKPVVLVRDLRFEIKEQIRAGWRQHAFNEFVSDLIPVNRSLYDARDKWCKHQNYSSDLPKATVVICFYNEAWSTLIRTVTSVLNRSPPHLLDQIILVDDHSTLDNLKMPLDDYVASKPEITLIRAPQRLGIIKARLLPIPILKSPVVVYLDSHCECTEGWLEPLLQRIKKDPSRVVSPVVDHIHGTTFEYIKQDTQELRLGGFTWDLQFAWIGIPRDIFVKRQEPAAPIKTPTISGGLFAIDKTYFHKIGYYDTDLEIWGGENLELSFKTWMCGGSLEIIPCSHVGHIFRKRIPYKEVNRSLNRNFVRVAEVWLDEYAKYYYERIGYDKGEYGDISKRIDLRKKLNCKSFKWYLENVYPQLEVPDDNAASGRIYSANKYDLCLDAAISLRNFKDSVRLIPCHFQGGNQYWTYTRLGEIRRDDICLHYIFNTVTLFLCNNAVSQVWLYFKKDKIIKHLATQQCMNMIQYHNGFKLVLTNCLGSRTQRWAMENFNIEKLALELQIAIKSNKNVYEKYAGNFTLNIKK